MSLLYELRKFKASRDAMRARRLRRLVKRRTRYHRGFDKAERRRFQAQLNISVRRTYGRVSGKEEKVIANMWRGSAELRWRSQESIRELKTQIRESEQSLRQEIRQSIRELKTQIRESEQSLRQEIRQSIIQVTGFVERCLQRLRSEVQAMISDTLNRLIPTGFIENPMKFILGFITGELIWNLLMGFLDRLADVYYATHSEE